MMRRNGNHRRNCRCPQCRTDSAGATGSVLDRNWTLLGYKLSNAFLLGLVIVLLLGIVAAAGVALGYKLGMDDGYGWQATSSIGFHVQPSTDRFPTYVYSTGNYTIDGYTFVVATSRHPKLAGDTVGYAPPGGPIYIETGRTVPDVYETCVHEKLHRTHPSAPHNWIYDVEDRVVDETCLKLLYDLGS
jgi:hypothetical protein